MENVSRRLPSLSFHKGQSAGTLFAGGARKLAEVGKVDYERIGERMHVEVLNLVDKGDRDGYLRLVGEVLEGDRVIILDTKDLGTARAALEICAAKKALVVDGGRGVALVGCKVHDIAERAVELNRGEGHRLADCDFYDLGEGVMHCLGGAPGKSCGFVVENCYIHHVGRAGQQAGSVLHLREQELAAHIRQIRVFYRRYPYIRHICAELLRRIQHRSQHPALATFLLPQFHSQMSVTDVRGSDFLQFRNGHTVIESVGYAVTFHILRHHTVHAQHQFLPDFQDCFLYVPVFHPNYCSNILNSHAYILRNL